MTTQLPPDLARFGEQYERAARRELPQRRQLRGLKLAAASSTSIAAIAAGAVLAISATTGTSPAYALTQNSDGSITISLSNLTAGISQLNARLQQLGLDYTVIPVTPGCTTTPPVLSAGAGTLSETITIGSQNTEPAGVDGYLAAEQLPNGQIALGIGGMMAPLPTCFAPTTLTTQPSSSPSAPSQPLARRSNASHATYATTTASAPLPLPASVKRQLRAKARQGVATTATTTTTAQP